MNFNFLSNRLGIEPPTFYMPAQRANHCAMEAKEQNEFAAKIAEFVPPMADIQNYNVNIVVIMTYTPLLVEGNAE